MATIWLDRGKQMKLQKRVLIVDDSKLGRLVLRNTVLRDSRLHVVGLAPDGTEGLVLFENTQPDLVIVDLEMPDMDGLEFLKKLSPDSAKSLVLAENFSHIKAILEHGADGVVVKSPKAGLPIASWQGSEILRKIYSILGLPEPDFAY